MKAKRIMISLLSLLTIGCLLAGCASQQSAAATPNPTTNRPEFPASIAPNSSGEVIIYDPSPYNEDLIQFDQCMKDIEERCTQNDWICLNGYLLPTEDEYAAAFDGDLNTWLEGSLTAKLRFDRPVEVWGAEFVFSNDLLSTVGYFTIGSADAAVESLASHYHYNKIDAFFYQFSSNTVWIELSEGQQFIPYEKPEYYPEPTKDRPLVCDYSFWHFEEDGTPLQEVRLYGRILAGSEIE